MSLVLRLLLYLNYLILGTYAIPQLRITLAGSAFPYSLVLCVVLALIVVPLALSSAFRTNTTHHIPPSTSMRPMPALMILIFLLSIFLSTSVSYHPEWIDALKYAVLVLILVTIILSASRVTLIERSLLLLALSSFAVFLYGAYGYFTGAIGDPNEHTFGYFGVTYMPATRNGDLLYTQTCFWILLAFYLFRRSARLRSLLLLPVIALAAAIVLSLARGAWISTGMTLLLVLLYSGRLKHAMRPLLLLLAIATGGAFIVWRMGPETSQLLTNRLLSLFTLSTEGGNSNLVRIDITHRVLNIIAVNPLGIGINNIRYYFENFWVWPVNHAENIYLQISAEQGWLGLCAYLLLLLWTLLQLKDFIRLHQHSTNEWIGWALLALIIDWSIYGLFNWLGASTWFWTVLALAVALANVHARHKRQPSLAPRQSDA